MKITKADDPAELKRLAEREIREWTKARNDADKEIKHWQVFIKKTEKREEE